MKIGVPKEIKTHEYRVGLVPSSVKELVSRGHQVLIESTAGHGIGINDAEYVSCGANVVASSDSIFALSDLIIKVKEPQAVECAKIRPNQILFTFLHLAADPELALKLIDSQAIAFAYETVTDASGRLPLLAPMSEVAGRIAVQNGAHLLERPQGGRGVLLGGVSRVAPAKVTILGGGVVGTAAIEVALGMGAEVTVLDRSSERLQALSQQFGDRLKAIVSTEASVHAAAIASDLVIGAVLVTGAAAPKIVLRETVAQMLPGSVLIDVAIDQGGCFETSRPTNFDVPTYLEYNVLHQCVTNLPGAVPRTSAFALNNATLPYIIEIADKGYKKACMDDIHLMAGLNVCRGKITHAAVAQAVHQTYFEAIKVLQGVGGA